MNMKKLTKIELIEIIRTKDREIALLRDRLCVATAPRPSAASRAFVPKEVVEAYFEAHPEVTARVVDRDTLMKWARTHDLLVHA